MMWGFGFGWVWMILVWLVIIGVIVWAVTRLSPGSDDPRRHDADEAASARRILDERFARGEIDVDEYRELRDELAK